MVFDQQRIHAEIEALAPRIIADRRHLHQHAETSLKEFGTAQYISDRLDSLGIDHVGVGETGLLGTLTGADEGPTILLRADIDALPLRDDCWRRPRSSRRTAPTSTAPSSSPSSRPRRSAPAASSSRSRAPSRASTRSSASTSPRTFRSAR